MSTSTSLGVTRLEALLESAQLLHSSLDLDDLLRHLLRSVMGRLLVTKAFIAVEQDRRMQLAQVRGLPKLAVGDEFEEKEARAAGIDLILPIGEEASPVGLLALGRPMTGEIGEEEIAFLRALLGIAASGIANRAAAANPKTARSASRGMVKPVLPRSRASAPPRARACGPPGPRIPASRHRSAGLSSGRSAPG